MEPFRELLKPPAQGKKVYWDENLSKLFQESKLVIVDAIKDGIKSFRMGEWTCLMPDFCKTGIGFLLTQKRCSCKEINPYCCSGGCGLGSECHPPLHPRQPQAGCGH